MVLDWQIKNFNFPFDLNISGQILKFYTLWIVVTKFDKCPRLNPYSPFNLNLQHAHFLTSLCLLPFDCLTKKIITINFDKGLQPTLIPSIFRLPAFLFIAYNKLLKRKSRISHSKTSFQLKNNFILIIKTQI